MRVCALLSLLLAHPPARRSCGRWFPRSRNLVRRLHSSAISGRHGERCLGETKAFGAAAVAQGAPVAFLGLHRALRARISRLSAAVPVSSTLPALSITTPYNRRRRVTVPAAISSPVRVGVRSSGSPKPPPPAAQKLHTSPLRITRPLLTIAAQCAAQLPDVRCFTGFDSVRRRRRRGRWRIAILRPIAAVDAVRVGLFRAGIRQLERDFIDAMWRQRHFTGSAAAEFSGTRRIVILRR